MSALDDRGRDIWTSTLGALHTPAGTAFRVWAPKPSDIRLVVRDAGWERIFPLEHLAEMWTSRYFRDSRLVSIGGGADEVMLRILSRMEGLEVQ